MKLKNLAISRLFRQLFAAAGLAFLLVGQLADAFGSGVILLSTAFYAAALFFGAYYGITNVMMPIFTRASFGDRDYAQIYSRVSMVASISNAAAAFIWGTVIDATHSYLPMFVDVIVLMALAIVTVVAIGRMQCKADNS